MSELVKDASLIVVGWLLATLSTAGADYVKERRRKQRFVNGLRIELARLQGVMAVLSWNLTQRDGSGGKDDLEWVIARTESAIDDDGVSDFRSLFASARTFSEKQWAELRREGVRRQQHAVSLQTYKLPFLESNLSDLTTLGSSKAVANVLDVRAQILIYNQVVAETREFHRMTFDSSVTADNQQSARVIVENRYGDVRRRTKWIADLIERTLGSGPLRRQK